MSVTKEIDFVIFVLEIIFLSDDSNRLIIYHNLVCNIHTHIQEEKPADGSYKIDFISA